MRNWYSIKALAQGDAEISIHDEIGFWGVTAKDFINDLKKIDGKNITLSINSPGGSVFDALAIFNALRNSGKQITVRVMGIAASAASYIAMAGDKIVMPENTFMMVHNPIGGICGNAEEMREMADILDKVGASLTATYVKRTGKPQEEVEALLAAESYLTAQECLDLGLADEIEPTLKISASFETDRLPENIKAVFVAAQTAQDPEPEDEPEPQEPAFADQVSALATAAGMGEFATVWALSTESVDVVKTRINEAREIKALCVLAKREDAAPGYIKAKKPLAEVRTELCNKLAEADEKSHNSTTPNNPGTHAAAQPAALKTADVWAARRQSVK